MKSIGEAIMATATATERLLTAEEFGELPDNGPTELVRGRIVTLTPPYPFHGFVCSNAAVIVGGFIKANDLGYPVGNDSGVITERGPDTVRGADFAFYSYQRLPKDALKLRGYLDVVPDLIIEVRSPDQPWREVLTKVAEYLAADVRVVCVLDVVRQTCTIYRPDEPETTLPAQDTLSLPDVLPGFSVRVGQFFE
jgi:Uma2 family endonuclease